MNYKDRIKKLEKDFSETNVRKGECLSKQARSQINQTYYRNQQKRLVDAILNNVRNKDSIKKEVHDIVEENRLKDLCVNCKEEVIISVIILYCQKTRNPRYHIEQTSLWRKYELTWQKYSLIVGRLLQKTRENTKVKSKHKVDDNLIRW